MDVAEKFFDIARNLSCQDFKAVNFFAKASISETSEFHRLRFSDIFICMTIARSGDQKQGRGKLSKIKTKKIRPAGAGRIFIYYLPEYYTFSRGV